MVDEFYDRGYQAARAELNAFFTDGLARLARSIIDAFIVLNRIEYGAPWRNEVSTPRCN